MTSARRHRGAAARRLGWAATALVAAVLGLAACGDDDTETTTGTTSTTENTPTGSDTSGTTTTGETTTTSTAEDSGSGGTGSGQNYDPEEDTAQNDIEPPEGSAAEEFEEQCEKNPESCG